MAPEVVVVRWAFWRRQRTGELDQPFSARAWPPPETPSRPAAAGSDEPDPDRRPAAAFSGASPRPGSDVPGQPAGGRDDLADRPGGGHDPELDTAGVRADVVTLVRAALARDRAATAQVLRRLDARGQDAPGMACLAAMAGLGDRLVLGAGSEPDAVSAGSAEVVAQGETVAARADALLRALAPHCRRDLVRLVVLLACGVPEQDPEVAHLMDAPPEDLALVAAVLLAQTVLDGQGDPDALAVELEDLLPG